MNIKAFPSSIPLLLLASISSTSLALEPDNLPLKEKLKPYSVDDIARQINQQPQWRVLAAEPTVEDNKTFYRFKVLEKDKGRVQVIVIDPEQPKLNQFD